MKRMKLKHSRTPYTHIRKKKKEDIFCGDLNEKEIFKRVDTYITDSLYCTPETNTS